MSEPLVGVEAIRRWQDEQLSEALGGDGNQGSGGTPPNGSLIDKEAIQTWMKEQEPISAVIERTFRLFRCGHMTQSDQLMIQQALAEMDEDIELALKSLAECKDLTASEISWMIRNIAALPREQRSPYVVHCLNNKLESSYEWRLFKSVEKFRQQRPPYFNPFMAAIEEALEYYKGREEFLMALDGLIDGLRKIDLYYVLRAFSKVPCEKRAGVCVWALRKITPVMDGAERAEVIRNLETKIPDPSMQETKRLPTLNPEE